MMENVYRYTFSGLGYSRTATEAGVRKLRNRQDLYQLGVEGLEPPSDMPNPTGNKHVSQKAGAKSGAFDAGLREVIDAWSKLPSGLKAAVLAVVRSAGKSL